MDFMENGAVVVSWSINIEKPESAVLLIGQPSKHADTKIINAYLGEDAISIRDMLINATKKEQE